MSMKLNKHRLMEMAGLLNEVAGDREAVSRFVWGRDQFMKHSEQEIERIIDEIDEEWQASKQNYSDVMEYLDELEDTGGLEMYMEGKKGATARLNESYEEEAVNLVSRKAGTILSMRQEADKAAFNLLDQALESLVGQFTQAGYDSDAIHAFFVSLVRDAIEMEAADEGEKTDKLNEGSYVEKMAPDTKELYFKYAKEIDVTDPNKIRDHKQLDDALKADPAFTKLSQQYLLKQALGWAITFAQQMER